MKSNGEELSKLKDNQHPLDIGINELYQDIEANNFLDLIDDENFIENRFGKTIKV
jgi:hypothetical protein